LLNPAGPFPELPPSGHRKPIGLLNRFDLRSKYPQFGGSPNAAQLQRAAALMHIFRLRNIALFRIREKCGRKRLRFLHQLHSKMRRMKQSKYLQNFCTLL